MVTLSVQDGILRHLATSSCAAIEALSGSNHRNPFPIDEAIRQVASDRLRMAGDHLRAGDLLFQQQMFRSSISRHYYAMYHAARAVVFSRVRGDDHQRHNELARHLPVEIDRRSALEGQLTEARLLRNEADYEPYPNNEHSWEADAQGLMVVASSFILALEEHAIAEGLI